MQNEIFTTHITFVDNGGGVKEEPITADQLASTITRLCEGPAAVMGIIERAIIVDSLDRICVEIKGRNIVYPVQMGIQQRAFRRAQNKAKNAAQN